MTTQTPAAKNESAPAPIAKSLDLTLRDDAGRTMKIRAERQKDGTGRSFVIVAGPKDAEGNSTTSRGATKAHKSFQEACDRVKSLGEKAKADGWKGGRTVAGQSRAKADAFDEDALPKPQAAAAGSTPAPVGKQAPAAGGAGKAAPAAKK
jgi:hypothetical protein